MEAIKKVLVVFPMDAPQREQLSAAFPELEFCFAGASEVTKEQVHAADVIFGNPSPNLIRGTKRLKWIQLNSAGTDGYTADGVLPDRALLTNATGAYGLTISEHLLGMLLMLGRTSHFRVLSAVCAVLTNVLRGVPSLLFIYFFFFAMPNLGIKMPAFWMLCIPVTLAASGVLAEVFRAGVNAVPRGQTEAGLSIGLTRWKVKTKIVLPQAIRFVIPSLISQLVVVVKDTALAYVVSYPDLMQNAQVLRTNYDALVSTFLVVALIYIVINYLINKLAVLVSRRTGVKIIR